jgi:hypothetical protein
MLCGKNAWIRENPEKYTTPVYPLKESKKTESPSLKRKKKSRPRKRPKQIKPSLRIRKTMSIEVEAH